MGLDGFKFDEGADGVPFAVDGTDPPIPPPTEPPAEFAPGPPLPPAPAACAHVGIPSARLNPSTITPNGLFILPRCWRTFARGELAPLRCVPE